MSAKKLKSDSTYHSTTSTVNEHETLINNLKVSLEAKNILHRVDKIAASNNVHMKKAVKDIFIISPSCKELSKFARCYERIIMDHGVYHLRGNATYMELAFPRGSEKDYKRFFDSPRIVASTQNYFTGVFLISFELWKSSRELLKEEYFRVLMKFVKENKSRISFVFHVRPEFEGVEELTYELSRFVNLLETCIEYPDLEAATDYVAGQLDKSGMSLTDEARGELKHLLKEKVDMDSPAYGGYDTLEMFVEDMRFELYDVVTNSTGSKEETTCTTVGNTQVRHMAEHVAAPVREVVGVRTLGFQ